MNHEAVARPFLRKATQALEHTGFTPPGDGEARVVLFDSAPWISLCADAETLLGSHERERAQRFRHTRDRETYVLAHACWRAVLGVVLDRDAASVPLASSPHGQPQLPGTAYATSLSHSDSHVAIAVARALVVGVDIERFPPRHLLHGLLDVLCSAAEAVAIEALPAAMQTSALLALWTRKEALLKAFGVGLREAPAAIVADVDRAIEPPASAADAPACHVFQLELPPQLIGALALPIAVTRHSVHWLDSPHGGESTSRTST